MTIWKNIVDDFQRDVDWTMAEPNQADLNLFDNGKVTAVFCNYHFIFMLHSVLFLLNRILITNRLLLC